MERGRTAVLEAEEEQAIVLNLLSTKQVMEYSIHAVDGNIGHVEDFIIDDEGWIIRYMAIDTSKWLPGSKKGLNLTGMDKNHKSGRENGFLGYQQRIPQE